MSFETTLLFTEGKECTLKIKRYTDLRMFVILMSYKGIQEQEWSYKLDC